MYKLQPSGFCPISQNDIIQFRELAVERYGCLFYDNEMYQAAIVGHTALFLFEAYDITGQEVYDMLGHILHSVRSYDRGVLYQQIGSDSRATLMLLDAYEASRIYRKFWNSMTGK
jgi:hypothetical protein